MSWRRFLRRARWDDERRRELESYIGIETDENIARGMSAESARDAALRKLGNRTSVREEIYAFNTIGRLDTFSRDVRYCIRLLRRNPTFTLVALLTLAIGIGATTAIFSVVNSVLIKPLPYPNADALVHVANRAPGAPGIADVSGDLRVSPSMFFTFAEENRTFEHLGVWFAGTGAVTGTGDPEQVRIVAVSEGTFEALDIAPLAGRWLTRADQQPGGAATAVLAYGVTAALASTRLLRSLLFEVSPLDPSTYVAVAAVLTVAATLASYIPARRASSVSPVEALSAE